MSFLCTALADLRGRRERTVVLEDICRRDRGTGDRSKGKNFFEIATILRITTDGDNRTAIKARVGLACPCTTVVGRLFHVSPTENSAVLFVEDFVNRHTGLNVRVGGNVFIGHDDDSKLTIHLVYILRNMDADIHLKAFTHDVVSTKVRRSPTSRVFVANTGDIFHSIRVRKSFEYISRIDDDTTDLDVFKAVFVFEQLFSFRRKIQ